VSVESVINKTEHGWKWASEKGLNFSNLQHFKDGSEWNLAAGGRGLDSLAKTSSSELASLGMADYEGITKGIASSDASGESAAHSVVIPDMFAAADPRSGGCGCGGIRSGRGKFLRRLFC
jgi:hypothetical protein